MDSHTQQSIPTGVLGDMGVALARFRCGQMGLIFREKPTQDHGIDAEIEILVGEKATGRLVSAQIKCGPSYFKEADDETVTFRFEEDHYLYWKSHSLPVIGVLVDHETETCYWCAISSETVKSTGKGYKVEVPKTQILNLHSRQALIDLATPIVSPAAFEVFDEEDVSTGIARRVSHYVRLNANERPWTKHSIRQLILQVTSEARASQYFRNEISAAHHTGSLAQVVWVYVYQSESHRNLGAYIARAIWIDPDLPEEFRPIGFNGESDESGLTIQWNHDFENIVKLIDEQRATKAEFTKYVTDRIYVTASVVLKYYEQAYFHERPVDYSEYLIDVKKPLEDWQHEMIPPHQCERLSDRIEELVVSLDNGRIFAERLLREDKQALKHEFKRSIGDAFARLGEVKYELKLVS